jgi:alkylation response protein AidB-like acyl-CoA dehydrogenase
VSEPTSALPDAGTYRLTEEQQMLRDAVRVLADEQIAPRAAEIDRTAEFPWDVKDLLASHDILGLPFPEAYGGLGGHLLTVCLAIEQISRACATSGLILAVQELGALPLLLAGSDEQKQRWFPDLAAGRSLIAFALTEAEAGSDAVAARTRARRDGDDWVIDGSKRFISQGSVADLVTVFAATDDPGGWLGDASPSAADVLRRREGHRRLRGRADRAQDGDPRLADRRALVPRRPGARREPRRRGRRGIPHRDADARPVAARDRGPGRGHRPGCARGRGALRDERTQFGRPIAEFQMIGAMLADMDAGTEAARQLLYKACTEIEAGAPDAARWSAMCKLVAGDTAMRVTTDAVQVLGGYGYIDEFPVERMMRDAKITQLYEGTQQIQRLVIARALAGRGG